MRTLFYPQVSKSGIIGTLFLLIGTLSVSAEPSSTVVGYNADQSVGFVIAGREAVSVTSSGRSSIKSTIK